MNGVVTKKADDETFSAYVNIDYLRVQMVMIDGQLPRK